MTQPSIIDEIADFFNHHEQVQRIKKLMYYAYSKKWEGEPKKVDLLSSKDLIEKLREENATIDELSSLMHRMVETLNRPDVYAHVSNIILESLQKLYNDSEETTQIVFADPKQDQPSALEDYLLDRVVKELEEHLESTRIKKLLFCVSQQRWENNILILNQYLWSELITELYQKYNNFTQFKQAVMRVVKTLNRQAVYSNVAQIVFQGVERLYQPDFNDKSQSSSSSPQTPAPAKSLEAPLLDDSLNSYYDAEELKQPYLSSPSEPEETDVQSGVKQKSYDPFEVKLQVMEYVNPLKAKILLFSLLDHCFDYSWQDWSLLRTCELDDLLKNLYQQNAQLATVESNLMAMAEELPDVSEQKQIAQAIIKALAPYYTQSSS